MSLRHGGGLICSLAHRRSRGGGPNHPDRLSAGHRVERSDRPGLLPPGERDQNPKNFSGVGLLGRIELSLSEHS